MRVSPLQRLLLPLCLAPVFIGLWYAVYYGMQPDNRFFLPTPHKIIAAFFEQAPLLAAASLRTGGGALVGFASAIVFSSLCAALLSLSSRVRAGLYPYLLLLQMTPVIVLSPILVLWVGAGFKSVAVITFLICVFPLIVNTTQGLLSVDRNLADLFRMARATRLQELLRLRLPSALPYFFAGLRISATLAPIGAVVGDFTAGDSAGAGLGYLTIIYSANFRYPELFATVLANCFLGFFFTGGVLLLSRIFLGRWHESHTEQGR